jgi:hypothetical protein
MKTKNTKQNQDGTQAAESDSVQRLVSSILFTMDTRENWQMIKDGWDTVTFPTSAHALIYLDEIESGKTQQEATASYFHQILGWENQHMLDLYHSS